MPRQVGHRSRSKRTGDRHGKAYSKGHGDVKEVGKVLVGERKVCGKVCMARGQRVRSMDRFR